MAGGRHRGVAGRARGRRVVDGAWRRGNRRRSCRRDVGGAVGAAGAWIGAGAARYAERVLTHEATFRSLADLRVWFFRNLAHGSAGGLGFRHAGDVLARLVGDIEALDELYLRILVPLAGAMLLFPLLVVLIGMHSVWLAIAIGVLFAIGAFALPWLSARAAARAGVALANAAGGLRIATLDALTGLREVRAFGAEGRMLAAVQAREATFYYPARTRRPWFACQCRRVAVRAGGASRRSDRGRQRVRWPVSPLLS